jgi:hypothetical protein
MVSGERSEADGHGADAPRVQNLRFAKNLHTLRLAGDWFSGCAEHAEHQTPHDVRGLRLRSAKTGDSAAR